MYRLDRQGAGICFEDVGKGAPPRLLLHDLGCDRSSFAPQIEHFRRNHRVVAVDLRGHGASDKPENEYSMLCLAGDVAWLSYELGLYLPVVVGHGLGGMIGIELAARYPDLLAAVVALDSFLLPPPETVSFLQAFGSSTERLPDPACPAALHQFTGSRFLPTGDLAHKDSVMQSASIVPRQAAAFAWRNALDWNGEAAMAACRVPVLYVDAGTGAADLGRLVGTSTRVTVKSAAGAGHFLHLQHPDGINDMIDWFLTRLEEEAKVVTPRPETG